MPGDATDPAVAKAVVDRVAAEVGPPEVLVNTIGTYGIGDALSATPEQLRQMMDVNVGPALWLTPAVAPYMKERGSSSITPREPGDAAASVTRESGQVPQPAAGIQAAHRQDDPIWDDPRLSVRQGPAGHGDERPGCTCG